MYVKDYLRLHGLSSEEQLTQMFRENLHSGHGDTSMTSCPYCGIILDGYYEHPRPVCKKSRINKERLARGEAVEIPFGMV